MPAARRSGVPSNGWWTKKGDRTPRAGAGQDAPRRQKAESVGVHCRTRVPVEPDRLRLSAAPGPRAANCPRRFRRAGRGTHPSTGIPCPRSVRKTTPRMDRRPPQRSISGLFAVLLVVQISDGAPESRKARPAMKMTAPANPIERATLRKSPLPCPPAPNPEGNTASRITAVQSGNAKGSEPSIPSISSARPRRGRCSRRGGGHRLHQKAC